MRQVLRNFSALTVARVVDDVALFGVRLWLARAFGAAGFGTLIFAFALVGYFSLLVTAGLNLLGARGVARLLGAPHAEPTATRRALRAYVGNIVTLRAALAVIAYGALAVFVTLGNQSGELKQITLLYGLWLFTIALTLDWVFLGAQRAHLVALGNILGSVFYLGGVLVVVGATRSLVSVPLVYMGGELAALGAFLFFGSRWLGGLALRPRFDLHAWRSILVDTAPLGLSSAMRAVNYNFGVVLIGFWLNAELVGYYGVAYSVVLGIVQFLALYTHVLLPGIVQAFPRGLTQVQIIAGQSLRLTALFVFPLAVGGTVLGAPLINFLFGAGYASSVAPFQILIWTVVLVGLNGTLRMLLLAANQQNLILLGDIFSASMNILLTVLFVPAVGLSGAASATVAADTLLVVLTFVYVNWRIVHLPVFGQLARILVAALAMGLGIYSMPDVFLPLAVGGGAMVYFLLLYALRAISSDDLRRLVPPR